LLVYDPAMQRTPLHALTGSQDSLPTACWDSALREQARLGAGPG